MFDTTRTPVKLYKWDDPGAPQVQYSDGSVKTILKACLVTGYGDESSRKEPLGWDILFEEANRAVFKSKAKENEGWSLSVDDSFRKKGGGQSNSHVLCRMIKNPSSVSIGTFIGDACHVGLSHAGFDGNGKWWLVGCDKSFILITSDNASDDTCGVLRFGLFPSLVAADSAHHLLYFSGGINGYGYSGYEVKVVIANNYEGLAKCHGFLSSKSNANYIAVDYPNPITGGFVADDCLVLEAIADGSRYIYATRGLLPGLMMIAENMPKGSVIPFGSIYNNLDASGDRYLYFRDARKGMLVNIDNWDI
ncbi:hypothetical protein [Neisseria yangbaofengii]|uniref:hypothetical protein n=1 Tax=Neisseria yangbaofengii TaxID=2709396 RepID=UPI0013EC2F25|nr:hypothetical protein [Neisseria yangbaofengii]